MGFVLVECLNAIHGWGRGENETLHIKDINGSEHLYYSGLLFKKKEMTYRGVEALPFEVDLMEIVNKIKADIRNRP